MHVCTCFNKSVHVFPFFQAKYRREAKKKRVLTQELHNSMYVIILLMCLLSVNNAVRLVLKKHLFLKQKQKNKTSYYVVFIMTVIAGEVLNIAECAVL